MASWNRGQSAGLDFLRAHIEHSSDECLIWPFSHNGTGYGHVAVNRKLKYAHRLMCEWTHGPAPTDQHQAAHRCGARMCVNPRHLAWETPSENQHDSIRHGTHVSQPGRKRWKLTAKQVSEIQALKGTMTLAEVGAIYSVTAQTIWKIYNGETWKTGKRTAGGFDRTPWTKERRREYGYEK